MRHTLCILFVFRLTGGNPFAAGGFSGFRRGGNVHEVSPEELFNMFFQGGGGGGFHFGGNVGGARNRGRQQGRHTADDHSQEQRAPQTGFQQILQFLPIILMILMSFSSFSSNSNSQPMFSLSPHGTYQREKATSMQGISPNIKFYVNSQFDQAYSKMSGDTYRRFEKEVESEYKHVLGVKCGNEKTIKNSKMYQARFSNAEARRKAEELTLPSCEEFQARFIDRFKK